MLLPSYVRVVKTVVLSCDACGWELKDHSAEVTVFDGRQRRDFCTSACFSKYYKDRWT